MYVSHLVLVLLASALLTKQETVDPPPTIDPPPSGDECHNEALVESLTFLVDTLMDAEPAIAELLHQVVGDDADVVPNPIELLQQFGIDLSTEQAIHDAACFLDGIHSLDDLAEVLDLCSSDMRPAYDEIVTIYYLLGGVEGLRSIAHMGLAFLKFAQDNAIMTLPMITYPVKTWESMVKIQTMPGYALLKEVAYQTGGGDVVAPMEITPEQITRVLHSLDNKQEMADLLMLPLDVVETMDAMLVHVDPLFSVAVAGLGVLNELVSMGWMYW